MKPAPIRSIAFLILLSTVACREGGSPTPPPAPPGLAAPIQVLMNTDFEQASPLVWRGDTGIIQPAPGTSSPGTVPHGGAKFAWLGGYGTAISDQITQDLFIPTMAQSATATFFVKILTQETGTAAVDTFTVAALNTANSTLASLLTKSNLDAADYSAYSVDLLPYKGQILRLSFKSQEDAQRATSFLLDDVVTNLVVPAATDLKPIITSFSPSSGVAGEVTVQIIGGNFFGLTGLSLGGTSATYALIDGTQLTAIVPATAATGTTPISLTNAQGTGSSATPFQVSLGPPPVPAGNPPKGPGGKPVVITGTYLGYPGTTVTLNGLAIPSITQTAQMISFTVPAAATSGNLVITTPGGSLTRTFTVNTASTTLDLHIERAQLTQSTQTLDNTVPIVAGRAGLIRVFAQANQTNTATPAVQITLLNGGLPVAGYPRTIPAPASGVPTALDESTLAASWNLTVPGTELSAPTGSGYSLMAVVDPGNTTPEADESNNALETALRGTTVPPFKTTIFPVVLSNGTGDISDVNKDAWVARLARMYPVAGVEVAVGAPFTGSVTTLSSDNKDGSWSRLLNDLAAKHLADGASDRYYFGALKVSYGSGIAGLGYVPNAPSSGFSSRTAIGWDQASGYSDGGLFPDVFAHETGHNMGRQHSPCGSVDTSDPDYPYLGGGIGVWGYDSTTNQLKTPAVYKDIMGYCSPNWVSDYVYTKILDFRGGTGGFIMAGAEAAPPALAKPQPRECLPVRGLVHPDGQVELLPSFRTQASPSTIPTEGEYTLEGLDQQDRPVFRVPLDLMELGCGPMGLERHFVMALPLGTAALDSLAGLKVLKAGQLMTSLHSIAVTPRIMAPPPDLRRLDEARIQLTWDATIHAAALLRDVDSGVVIAILSGGRQSLSTKARRFDLVLSDGIAVQTHRLNVAD